MVKKIIAIITGIMGLCLVLVVGAVLFWPKPTNPPVVQEPNWDSPETRALAQRACFDCHSNETTWPIYTNLPPVSFLLRNHVYEGREKLNFSEWGQGEQEVDEIAEVIEEGEMPMLSYLPMHPEARLSKAERQALIDGLAATTGAGSEGHEDGDND